MHQPTAAQPKEHLIVYNFQLNKPQSDKLLGWLSDLAAEHGESQEEEITQMCSILKAQIKQQNGIVNAAVSVACVDCKRGFKVPNELLKGQFLEASEEFFCAFCDPYCRNVRCVTCRLEHTKQHAPSAIA